MNITLPAPVQGYIDASNAMDGDALIDCFADDAFVNDARTHYFTVRDDRIVRLIIIRNEPTPLWARG